MTTNGQLYDVPLSRVPASEQWHCKVKEVIVNYFKSRQICSNDPMDIGGNYGKPFKGKKGKGKGKDVKSKGKRSAL